MRPSLPPPPASHPRLLPLFLFLNPSIDPSGKRTWIATVQQLPGFEVVRSWYADTLRAAEGQVLLHIEEAVLAGKPMPYEALEFWARHHAKSRRSSGHAF